MTRGFFLPGSVLGQTGLNSALVTFLIYLSAVFALAWLSNRQLKKRNFLSEYFLGSRALGIWAFAMTFAATSASGGSFTGFPSKIYTHGWVLGLWIGSYLVVPICAIGLLGKRINQVARISGSITIPDIIRDRFRSPAFGLLSVALIVFFMSFNLVAQFKSGSLILKTLLSGVDVFHRAAIAISSFTSSVGFLSDVDPEYLICLFTFGVAVVVYTTYGGFRAVVWTDVMQGVVMVMGVIIMLPLALYLVGRDAPPGVGGLEHATREMAKMIPPQRGTATLSIAKARDETVAIGSGSWVTLPENESGPPRLFRIIKKTAIIESGKTSVDNVKVLEIMTHRDITAVLSGSSIHDEVTVSKLDMTPYQYGANRQGVYVTGPGPSETNANGFLPLSLAISFFFMWAIAGSGQPSSMVRQMAFKNSLTLGRAIFTVAIYYSMIYFPLVIIFCCARILMPGMDAESDRIMPAMAVFLTENISMGWLAGLLVAAPFAAVMSTVDSFLLMISSGLVRDIYQRNINPNANESTVKWMSYLFTIIVGTGAVLGAVNPPQYLQDIIVYTGSGLAACFLAPMVFGLYWPRANTAGCMSGMLAGFLAHLAMYVVGFAFTHRFEPWRPFSCDPTVTGLVVSFVTVYIVTKLTAPPSEDLVRKYFYKQ